MMNDILDGIKETYSSISNFGLFGILAGIVILSLMLIFYIFPMTYGSHGITKSILEIVIWFCGLVNAAGFIVILAAVCLRVSNFGSKVH